MINQIASVVFRSQRSFLGYAFCLLDLLLFPFSDCCSCALCGIWFMFYMAHFSAFDDSCSRVVQKRLPFYFVSYMYEHSLHSIM